MKKIAAFSISLGVAFFIFIAAAVAVLFMSGTGKRIFGTQGNSQPKELETPKNAEPVSLKSARLLLIYEGKEEVYMCVADVCPSKCEVTAEAISLLTPSELYCSLKTQGIYVFTSRVLEEERSGIDNYIKFNSESFGKITDRFDGLVYNNENRQILVTGTQAVEALNGTCFAEFAEQLIEKMLTRDACEEFLYIADATVNDLSYPKFYDFYRQ